uniref:Uncharacterized protein n=1 Tax=viral metagenome TaxID=1070528 RepID=A0A6C0HU00_9ZZZZ
MVDLCKYKDIFGKPNTGAHKYRFFNIAIVDVALVIIAGFFLSWFFKWNVWYTLGGLFLLGIFSHRIFCVRSTVDKLLFP